MKVIGRPAGPVPLAADRPDRRRGGRAGRPRGQGLLSCPTSRRRPHSRADRQLAHRPADVRPAGAGFRAVDPATGAELEPGVRRGRSGRGRRGPRPWPQRPSPTTGGPPPSSGPPSWTASPPTSRRSAIDPHRPGHGRDRTARRPGRRRDRPYGRSAAAVRHRRPRRRLAAGPHRHAPARPHSAAPPGSAAALRSARTGRGVRGQQLPAGVLGGRRATPPPRWPPAAR